MKTEFDNDTKAENAVAGIYGGRFDHEGIPLLFGEALGDGLLNIRNLQTGGPYQPIVEGQPGTRMMPDIMWAEREISEGRLVQIRKVDLKTFETEHDDAEALALDPMAGAKAELVRHLAQQGVGPNDPRLSGEVTRFWKEQGFDNRFGERPETKTVRNWWARGDGETTTMGQLVSQSGRVKRASRVDPLVEPLLEAAAEYFWDKQGNRVVDSRAKLAADGKKLNAERAKAGLASVKLPSRETVRRRICEKLDREHYARKYGEAAAKKNFDGGGLGLAAERIGQLGVMDDTVLDTVACFDADRGLPAGRPYLCIIVDVASRCIVGYLLSFEPPTTHTALETIRAAARYNRVPKELLETHPILERINLKFEEIVTDRGSNYTSHAFGQALLDVGTALRFARVRHARDKAIVERVFHTFKTFLLEKLPGATFAPKLMREFGYDPEKVACLTVTELRELIEHFIALYHITVHSGIGMQPALFWSKSLAKHGRQLLTSSDKFGLLTGETVFGVRVDREGITTEGIRYVSETNLPVLIDAMAGAQAARTMDHFERPLAEDVDAGDAAPPTKVKRRKPRRAGLGNDAAWATVKVKINTANLLRIHAWVPDHGWLPFEAANRDYADGLSRYQHARIKEWAAARNMAFSTEEDQLAARHALAEHILELAPDMNTRERRALARLERIGDGVSAEADHLFTDDVSERDDGSDADADPVIETNACDDRADADVAPTSARKSSGSGKDGGGKADRKGGKPAFSADAQLLRDLMATTYEMPIDEDAVLEEFA